MRVERYLERYGNWNASLYGQTSLQNIPLRLLDPAVPPLHKVIGSDAILPSDLSRRKITGSEETVDPRAGNLEDVRHVVYGQERAVLVKQPGQYRVIGLLCTDIHVCNLLLL